MGFGIGGGGIINTRTAGTALGALEASVGQSHRFACPPTPHPPHHQARESSGERILLIIILLIIGYAEYSQTQERTRTMRPRNKNPDSANLGYRRTRVSPDPANATGCSEFRQTRDMDPGHATQTPTQKIESRVPPKVEADPDHETPNLEPKEKPPHNSE